MAIGCKIVRNFPRPDRELVEAFRDVPAANIDDCMGRTAAADAGIRPVGKGQLLGTAFTVRVPQGDNLMFHAAMDLAQPGDVIVIDAGGYLDRSILGELMATYCKTRGIRGIICDGAIRDRDALAEMEDFPVYARGANPNGPYKNGPGEIGTTVCIGNRVVNPGDIVVGDGDGIVFISPADAPAVLEGVKKVQKMEEGIMENIVKHGTYVRPWVDEKLKEIGCTFVD